MITGRNLVFPFSKDVEKINFQQLSKIFESWLFKFGERRWKIVFRRLSAYRKMNFSIFQIFRKTDLQICWNMLKNHLPTISYFSKDGLVHLSKVLKFELSIFQKDVENSFIDIFQFFEIWTSPIFRKFLNLNFRFFKKMSKTHLSTSFNFSKYELLLSFENF